MRYQVVLWEVGVAQVTMTPQERRAVDALIAEKALGCKVGDAEKAPAE